jgi:iron complex outermembrane receptor protein
VTWGAGYRFTTDEFSQAGAVLMDPPSRHLNLYTMFAQDNVTLIPNRLNVIVGSKLEHNDYTGFELQPSIRVRWTPQDHHVMWASLSHAVSTPSRLVRGSRVDLSVFQPSPSGPLFEASIFGNDDVESERLDAIELGYRFEASAHLSFDLATFYNRYRDLVVALPDRAEFELTPAPHVLLAQQWANGIDGYTYGSELSVQWQPLDIWRVTGTYSYIAIRVNNAFFEATSPDQQASIRSYLNLPRHLELNAAAYYVSRIQTPVVSGLMETPAYVRLDVGMTWHPADAVEWGLWGQNLLDGRHPESPSFTTTQVTEVPRGAVGRITWRF